ncbi:MAG: hypothetical protein ACI4J3_08075 [Oscillospiraceae bacterium]
MKKMVSALISFAIVAAVQAAVASNNGVRAASAKVTASGANSSAISENTQQYVDEFMELSSDEVEALYNKNRYNSSVGVLFTQQQWNQMVDEFLLEYSDSLDNPVTAFYDLVFEKLHLKGVYEALADQEFYDEEHKVKDAQWYVFSNIRGYDPNEWKFYPDEPSSMTMLSIHPAMAYGFRDSVGYPLVYEGNQFSVTGLELINRTMYVIDTYGDKDYFSYVYIDPLLRPSDDDNPEQTTTTETTTTTTTTTTVTTATTVTTTTTANGVATGDAPVMYLLLAGVGAAAAASLTQKRKKRSV